MNAQQDFQNRIGQDGFNWWIGVVEEVLDPLNLGRSKVRIFGIHTEDLNLIPTADLPWAQSIYPITAGGSKTSSYFKEGDYVCGFFADGSNSQVPMIMGSMPGVPQQEPKDGIGFSPEAKYYRNPVSKSDIPKPIPNATAADVLVSKIIDGSTTIIEKITAPGMLVNRIGFPTIPTTTYSVEGTTITIANEQTVHACDFKFLINFGDLGLDAFENPITVIKNAIASGKNKAALIIRSILNKIIEGFRLVRKGIIATLNLDPSGQISRAFSVIQDIIRKVNYYAKKIAEYVEVAALVIELVRQLRQIIDYIRTLPERIIAILRDCLSTFLGAVNSAIGTISSIPETLAGPLTEVFEDLASSTEQTVNEIQDSANLVTQNTEIVLPNNIITYITSPENANTEELLLYYQQVYPNTNVVISQYNVESYNIANNSSP
jgi:hypothetical protein